MARRRIPKEIGENETDEVAAEVQNEVKGPTIPTNFRVSKVTADKFRSVAFENFVNQDSALNAMLELYSKAQLKRKYPAYAGEIENFQKYLDILHAMYTALLMNYSVVDESAKATVQNQLQEKDEKIKNLETEIKNTKSSLQELGSVTRKADKAEADVKKLDKEKSELQTDIYNLKRDYGNALSDKETINQGLHAEIEALNQRLEEYSQLPEKIKELETKLFQMDQKLKEQEYAYKIDDLQKKARINEEIMELRNNHSKEIEGLRESYDKREDSIRAQYDKRIDIILRSGRTLEESGNIGKK